MTAHLKKQHNITYEKARDAWKKLTREQKNKFKSCNDKTTIYENSKYLNSVTLRKMYRIFEKKGEKGLEEYQQEIINKCNPLYCNFHKFGLIKNKHIPKIYLEALIEQRKALLAGLVDSDGTSGGKSKNNVSWEIVQSRENIIDDIEILAKSLGMTTYKSIKYNKKYNKNYYRIVITPFNNYDIPILLPRKQIPKQPTSYPKIGNMDSNKIKNQWTDDKLILLLSIVEKFKTKYEKIKLIPWKKIQSTYEIFNNHSSDSLKSTYEKHPKMKTLINKIDKDLDITNIYEDDINKFSQNIIYIQNILNNKMKLSENKTLYQWYYSRKNNYEKSTGCMKINEIRKCWEDFIVKQSL